MIRDSCCIFLLFLLLGINCFAQEQKYQISNDGQDVYNDPNNTTGVSYDQAGGKKEEKPSTGAIYPLMKSQSDAQISQVQDEVKTQPLKVTKLEVSMESGVTRAQRELQDRISKSKNISLKKEQIAAFGLPTPVVQEHINNKTQILPPNISQKIYGKNNRHLYPVVFEEDYIYDIFEMIKKDEINQGELQAIMSNLTQPFVVDKNGNTLLMHAIKSKKYNIVTYLINNGVNVNMGNNFTISPLHLASYMGDHISSVLLAEAGAYVDIRDKHGNTPLMYACLSGDVVLVRRLIEYGANINDINDSGLELMDFAYESENLDLVNFLINKNQSLIRKKSLQNKSQSEINERVANNELIMQEYQRFINKSTYFYYAS